mmetsp:Transcript_16435/g.62435  ORF Transcript_16435/g.62435 Transcript_16435/m.62435 type:complete len:258 (+) Transcript_16435:40-813(+)
MSDRDAHVAYLVKNLDSGQEWHVSDLWQVSELQKVDTFDRVSAHISGASLRSGARRPTYVCYELQVFVPGKRPYSLFKRYSDFLELNRKLETHRSVAKVMAASKLFFPPKVWLGNLRSDVVLFRQRALNLYLKQILRDVDVDSCEAFEAFLAPPDRLRRGQKDNDAMAANRGRVSDPSLTAPLRRPEGRVEQEASLFLDVIEKQRQSLVSLQQENVHLRKHLAERDTQVQRMDYAMKQMEEDKRDRDESNARCDTPA